LAIGIYREEPIISRVGCRHAVLAVGFSGEKARISPQTCKKAERASPCIAPAYK